MKLFPWNAGIKREAREIGVDLRVHVHYCFRLCKVRPSCVANIDSKPAVCDQDGLKELRIAKPRPELWAASVIRSSRLRESRVNHHRNIELFTYRPIGIEPRLRRSDPSVLRVDLAEN